MRKNYLIPLLSLLLFLSGCSASGPRYQSTQLTSQSNGLIYIYRPAQFVNGGGYPEILINNESIGPLKNGGYLYAEVSPGRYHVRSKGNVMHWLLPDQSTVIDVRSGETVYLRLLSSASAAAMIGIATFNMERQSNLHQVLAGHAQQEIRSMKLSK